MVTHEINSSVKASVGLKIWVSGKCQFCLNFYFCPVFFNGLCLCEGVLKKKRKVKDLICVCERETERVSGCADRSWNALKSLFRG